MKFTQLFNQITQRMKVCIIFLQTQIRYSFLSFLLFKKKFVQLFSDDALNYDLPENQEEDTQKEGMHELSPF